MTKLSTILVSANLLWPLACVPLSADGGVAPPRAGQTAAFGVCPKHLCGSNSDIAGSFSFRITGMDEHGLLLRGVHGPDGRPLTLKANGNFLWAVDADGNTLREGQMVGVEIVLEDTVGGDTAILTIDAFEIAGVESMRYPDHYYPTYQFGLQFPDMPEFKGPLCSPEDWDPYLPIHNANTKALIVQHEAYDYYGNPMLFVDENPEEAELWVTIGCSGGAFAKKILMGYDLNNGDPADVTTRAENDAVMHMLAARYCEDGTNHTTRGTRIYWQNDRGWFDPPADVEIEAIWYEHGAVCLNTPRLDRRRTIERECGEIPRCDGFDPRDYKLVSYNPL